MEYPHNMLREKEYYIMINLQMSKHTYLYSSVREKMETKFKFNRRLGDES